VIRLPVVAEGTDQEPQKQAGEDAQSLPTSKRRILVVDDNKVSAKSLGMLLRMVGHEVNIANDGLEAVEAAAMFHPEVVVLDIGMPKLNGYEAARRIRAQQGGESIVLIALTGWGQEEDHRRSQAAGFNHHLTKPVELDAFQTLL
jgi:CheY-like chemotaxis protein